MFERLRLWGPDSCGSRGYQNLFMTAQEILPYFILGILVSCNPKGPSSQGSCACSKPVDSYHDCPNHNPDPQKDLKIRSPRTIGEII